MHENLGYTCHVQNEISGKSEMTKTLTATFWPSRLRAT